jgi:hypothetical protein
MSTLCSATCKDGGACHYKAKTGHAVCGKHMAQDRVVVVVMCGHRMTNGAACTHVRANGYELCARHQRVVERRAEILNARLVFGEALDALWTDSNPELAVQRLNDALMGGRIDEERYTGLAEMLDEELVFWGQLHVLPEGVAVKSDLHRLSLDAQNVHTKEVNALTNDSLALLLSTDVSPDQNTLADLNELWANKKGFKSVKKDMLRWYETATCREDNDRLYKRTLDGLWANIKMSKFKNDLLERLWEECFESVKMCCDGHISRLCNVLVGFDDAFKPEIPIGVLLQQKMSAIAAKDVRVEYKVGEAWAVFEELNIPRDQRLDWLEAF